MSELATRHFDGKNLVLARHTSVIGGLTVGEGIPPAAKALPVRAISISEVTRYAQHDRALRVEYTLPRDRWRGHSFWVVPDNVTYITVERNAQTLYDSRTEIPCDMDHWQATRARFEAEWREHFASMPGIFGGARS